MPVASHPFHDLTDELKIHKSLVLLDISKVVILHRVSSMRRRFTNNKDDEMKELTAFEIADVSGAGFASLGSSVGDSAWAMAGELSGPVVGCVNRAPSVPLSSVIGKIVNLPIVFSTEAAIPGFPVVGGLLN